MNKREISLSVSFGERSYIDGELDHCFQQEVDYRAGEDGTVEGTELEHPEPLRLTTGELHDIYYKHTDWDKVHEAATKDYVQALDYLVDHETDLDLALEYVVGQGEACVVLASADALKVLYVAARLDGFKALCELDQCAPEDAGPVEDWTPSALGSLVEAMLPAVGVDYEDGDLERAVSHVMAEGDGLGQALREGLDYEKIKADIAAKRDEKLADLRDEDPDHPLCQPPTDLPPWRCPNTLDLFGQGADT